MLSKLMTEFRRSNGITQKELGCFLNVSGSYIGKIERGEFRANREVTGRFFDLILSQNFKICREKLSPELITYMITTLISELPTEKAAYAYESMFNLLKAVKNSIAA